MDFLWTYLSTIGLVVVGFLLMFIILLQRGRGGGLAGAFGGLGGQSAFGTKAGDVFTKITIGLAVIWVFLAALSGFAMRAESSKRFKGGDEPASVKSTEPQDKTDENSPFDDLGTDQDTGTADTLDPDKPDSSDKPDSKEQPASDESKAKDEPSKSAESKEDSPETKTKKQDDKKQ